jgi:hypothetical protein
MVGIKGRSGKVTTPEQRLARRAAARLGGQAKAAKTRAPRARQPDDEDERDPDDDVPDVDQETGRKIEGWIDYKDSLDCRIKREKIKILTIEAATKQDERDKVRGKLKTVEQVAERDARILEVYLGSLQELTEGAIRLFPSSDQARARSRMDGLLQDFRRTLAEKLTAL